MGKRVKCINTTGLLPSQLTLGTVYEVTNENPMYYYFAHNPGSFSKSRFIDVVEEMKEDEKLMAPIGSIVTCIDASVVISGEGLVVGQDYEVIGYHPTSTDNYYLKGVALCYIASRFKIKSKPTISSPTSKANATIDIEEDKCWMMMRPHVGPGECICGILKTQCTYHK
jgi:hypothetical protein